MSKRKREKERIIGLTTKLIKVGKSFVKKKIQLDDTLNQFFEFNLEKKTNFRSA